MSRGPSVVLDVQALQSAAYARRGIGRYVAELARVLARRGAVDAFAWNDRLPAGSVLADLDRELVLGDRLLPFSALRAADVDVLHVPAPFAPLQRAPGEANDVFDMAVPVRARRLVITLHDLIPWRFPDHYLPDPFERARYHSRLAMIVGADVLLADSQSAADDAIELLGVDPRRVSVAGAGPGPQFTPSAEPIDVVLDRLRAVVPSIGAGFVVVPAALDWRKNLDGALAAFARLPAATRAAHQLVVVAELDATGIAAVQEQAGRLGVGGDVIVPGFVGDAALADLYRAAAVVMVPSRYEGFGLPVVEARSCGARVICSDVSSLPEVLPDPRARFDPDDVEAMADVLQRALEDPEFGALLDHVPPAPYGWDSVADRTVDAYERCRRRPRATADRRPRLGMVTITPPTPSGIADHSARLVEAMATHDLGVDVEVFTPGGPRRLDRAPAVEVRHVGALAERWASGAIDSVLYVLGNDPANRLVFDAMRAIPGDAFVHEVRLRRLYGAEAAPSLPPAPASDAEYGAAPVVHAARIVLVQSAHAADLLEEGTGIHAVDVGPHPCWNDGSSEPIDDPGPPWVISAGIAHEAKRTDLFVAAARLLRAERDVRVAIVGDGGPRFVTPDDEISIPGQVDDVEFDRWLRRAAVAVQLRAFSNGESSGVVSHALARGVPVVVTDIGAMRELPDDVAVRVPVDATPEMVAEAIGGLLADPERRRRMRRAALDYAARHTAAHQARAVIDAVRAGAGVRG